MIFRFIFLSGPWDKSLYVETDPLRKPWVDQSKYFMFAINFFRLALARGILKKGTYLLVNLDFWMKSLKRYKEKRSKKKKERKIFFVVKIFALHYWESCELHWTSLSILKAVLSSAFC